MLRGKTQVEVHEAIPGDICAIAKIDDIQFDHILHDSAEDAHVHAKPLDLPTPVFGLAVQPKKRGDEQKVSDVLHKILAEDPCFRIEHNSQANETVMRGLGEMHLKTVLEKMSSQYKLDLDTRPFDPVSGDHCGAGRGHSRHKKQTGGAGQFGEVFLKVEPLPRGKGFEFVDSVKGGAIPNQFIPSVEKGVRAVLDSGYLAGYPLQDVRVTCTTAKAIPWIRRTSRSSPPGARRFSTRSPRRAPSCSSQSSTWRSRPPKTAWATSRASFPAIAARSRAPTRRAPDSCRSRPRRRSRSWNISRRG